MKEQIRKIKAIHVGASGFPFGSAAINRCIGIYSILYLSDIEVLAINNKAIHSNNSSNKVIRKGVHFNVSYINTTPLLYRSNNPIKRRLNNLIGAIGEFFLILKLGFTKKIDIMFFYPKGFFFDLVYYRFLSLIFGFPIITHYVEYRTSFDNRKNKFWLRVNDILFDKYFMFFVDGAFPISEYLITKIKERRINLPILKIPPLVDFSLFANIKKKAIDKYFLYVGSTGYYKAIKLVLDAFELIENDKYYLVLIVNGSKIDRVKSDILKNSKKKLIRIYSNIDYGDLIQHYINAASLLIPLSGTIQDEARFPQKISEYSASKNPIITTNFGEIKYYFEDSENALIAKDYTPLKFSEKMNFIINNPIKSKEIGLKGYNLGLIFFDSNSYIFKLKDFILKRAKI